MRKPILLVLLLLLPALTGCIWSREIARVRRDIERQVPEARFKKQLELSLGPVSLQVARWIVPLVRDEDAQQAARYLRDVRRVKVGVYEIDFAGSFEDVRLPSRLRRLMEHNRWEMAVRVQEDDELVYLLYRPDGPAIRRLFVVALDGDEMVLVRLDGNLDRLITRALRDYGPGSEGFDWAAFEKP